MSTRTDGHSRTWLIWILMLVSVPRYSVYSYWAWPKNLTPTGRALYRYSTPSYYLSGRYLHDYILVDGCEPSSRDWLLRLSSVRELGSLDDMVQGALCQRLRDRNIKPSKIRYFHSLSQTSLDVLLTSGTRPNIPKGAQKGRRRPRPNPWNLIIRSIRGP